MFKDVVVNDYGAITNWPEGFFDQGQREAEDILRAAIDKKRMTTKESRRGCVVQALF